MDNKILDIIEELVDEANMLFDISEDDSNAPMVQGRALWKRSGILRAVEVMCEYNKLNLNDMVDF